ncbi:hypothetical protein C8R43DRAFT_1115588 [Mycena crocata]|nr:hypothetical protein C8R43DRAFT_1115588 [Mycena crocata]
MSQHWVNSVYGICFGFIHLGGGVPAEIFYISLQSQLAQIILRYGHRQYTKGDPFQSNGVHSLSKHWVITGIVLSLFISAYSTGMISFRILRMQRAFPDALERLAPQRRPLMTPSGRAGNHRGECRNANMRHSPAKFNYRC